MDILIKDMEMPEDWRNCPFSNGAAQCKLINMEICDKQHTHRSICPLVPVQTPHGRLGDLDRLESDLRNMAKYQSGYRQQGILGCCETIRLAPAIIPAEEGE